MAPGWRAVRLTSRTRSQGRPRAGRPTTPGLGRTGEAGARPTRGGEGPLDPNAQERPVRVLRRSRREHRPHRAPHPTGAARSWHNLTGACRRCNIAKSSQKLLQCGEPARRSTMVLASGPSPRARGSHAGRYSAPRPVRSPVKLGEAVFSRRKAKLTLRRRLARRRMRVGPPLLVAFRRAYQRRKGNRPAGGFPPRDRCQGGPSPKRPPGLEVAGDGAALGGGACGVVGHHAGGLPVAGAHDVGGGGASPREFRREAHAARVRGHPPLRSDRRPTRTLARAQAVPRWRRGETADEAEVRHRRRRGDVRAAPGRRVVPSGLEKVAPEPGRGGRRGSVTGARRGGAGLVRLDGADPSPSALVHNQPPCNAVRIMPSMVLVPFLFPGDGFWLLIVREVGRSGVPWCVRGVRRLVAAPRSCAPSEAPEAQNGLGRALQTRAGHRGAGDSRSGLQGRKRRREGSCRVCEAGAEDRGDRRTIRNAPSPRWAGTNLHTTATVQQMTTATWAERACGPPSSSPRSRSRCSTNVRAARPRLRRLHPRLPPVHLAPHRRCWLARSASHGLTPYVGARTLPSMNELAQRIGEAVADSVAASQAEVTTLLDKLREDIDALQQAINPPGRGATRRAAGAGRRRRKAAAGEVPQAAQAASRQKQPTRTRRARTPEERAEISKRMTAYWQKKREEKAARKK